MRVVVLGVHLLLVVGAAAGARPARADQGAASEERYVLSSVRDAGAESCPGTGELAREVERRLGRAVFDRDAPRSLEVHVERVAEGFRSKVYVRDADGRAVGQREMISDEPSCAPLFAATALALALLIDPDAALAPSEGEGDVVASAIAPPARVADAVPVAAPAPEPATPRAAAAAQRLPPARVQRELTASALGRGLVGFDVVPGAVPGLALAVGFRPGRSAFGFELDALYLTSGVADPAVAELSIGLTALGVAATVDAVRSRWVVASLQAGAKIGALHAAVRAPEPRNPGDFAYFALMLGGRARFPLGGGWFTEGGGALLVPVVRRGFFVSGEPEPVWREPALSATLGAGVGIELL